MSHVLYNCRAYSQVIYKCHTYFINVALYLSMSHVTYKCHTLFINVPHTLYKCRSSFINFAQALYFGTNGAPYKQLSSLCQVNVQLYVHFLLTAMLTNFIASYSKSVSGE